MKSTRQRHTPSLPAMLTLPLALVTGLGLLLAPGPDSADAAPLRHLQLLRAEPAADTVVTERPAEVRLFFSEPPRLSGTTVRVVDGSGELVQTTDASAEEDDGRQVFVTPASPLGSGSYTVIWRAIAQDGHPQRGEYGFRVAP